MTFDSIEDLINKFKDDCVEVIPNMMEDVYEPIARRSYDLYTPKNEHTSRYRDGIEGSFADRINLKHETTNNRNSVELTMENTRISDCGCSYCNSEDQYLDYYIENGIAGGGNITPKYVVRDVQNELDSRDFKDKISRELSKKGWNIK